MRFKYLLLIICLMCCGVFAQENSKATVNIKIRLIKGSSPRIFQTGEDRIKLNMLFKDVLRKYDSENKIKGSYLQECINYLKKINPGLEITAQAANYVELDTRKDDTLYVRIDRDSNSPDNISSSIVQETLAVSLVYN